MAAVGVTGNRIRFVKGHGTQNDFIVLPDLDSSLQLTPGRVRALTDRRRGLGADGVLRVVPTAATSEVADQAPQAKWFMDHRNSDGSTAEMCGNGARVFARYLLDHGLETSSEFAIATRGGTRQVSVCNDVIAIEVGLATPVPTKQPITVTVGEAYWPAVGVLFANPHAVVFVDDMADAGELRVPPVVAPGQAFPDGVNVEFAVARGTDQAQARVYERGVGETRSCGTGAVAVGWALRQRQGSTTTEAPVVVEVPGGRLQITERTDGRWVLAGPTAIVAEGEIDLNWWQENA